MAQRETEVYDMLISGERTANIIKNIAEKYGVSRRRVEEYITSARALIKEQAAVRRETAFETQSALIALIIQRSLAKDDLRTCLEALRENAKLYGLYESDKKLFDLDKIIIERQLITFNQNIETISKEKPLPETE